MKVIDLLRRQRTNVIRPNPRVVIPRNSGLARRQRDARDALGKLAIDYGTTRDERRHALRPPSRNVVALWRKP